MKNSKMIILVFLLFVTCYHAKSGEIKVNFDGKMFDLNSHANANKISINKLFEKYDADFYIKDPVLKIESKTDEVNINHSILDLSTQK